MKAALIAMLSLCCISTRGAQGHWLPCSFSRPCEARTSRHLPTQTCHQHLIDTCECTGNVQALQSALRGAKAAVCTGRLGSLLQAAEQQNLQHIVVVSSAGEPAHGHAASGHAASDLAESSVIFHLLRGHCPSALASGPRGRNQTSHVSE